MTFHIYDNISLNSSQNENWLDKICRENQNTFYIQQIFSESFTVYEIMSKNVVETEGPHITSQYGIYELHAG